MPGTLGVIFELRRAATRPGEAICVAGSRAELGWWRPLPQELEEEVRSLRTSPAMYPSWTSRAPIWFEFGAEQGAEIPFEYKFVRDMRGLAGQGHTQAEWEASIENRRVSLPAEDGSLWVVSHCCWGCDWDTPRVTRMLPKDVASCWAALRPFSRRPLAAETGSEAVHSARGTPTSLAGSKLPMLPLAAMMSPVAHELQRSDLHSRDYYIMTPREQEQDMSNAHSVWPIEEEFSTNFSQAQSSSDEEENAKEELEFVRQESAAKDQLLRELKTENERLRVMVAEAYTAVERDEGSFPKKHPHKDFDEPQEEPRANGESPKATHHYVHA